MAEAEFHNTKPVVRLAGLKKNFGATLAVAGVDLDIRAGQTLGLVGENGAGKSTLMRILAGFYQDYEGTIELEGKTARIESPRQARRLGVALVHQELSLVPELSVADNIFLGREPGVAIPGFISRDEAVWQAGRRLDEIGVKVDPRKKISALCVAHRQLVEIAKGLAGNPKVLILDEPTSSLTAPEIAELFRVIRLCVERGAAVVYISHKLDEVFAIADVITVMRDGQKVATAAAAEWDEGSLVRAMVGRELDTFYPHTHQAGREIVALSVANLSRRGAFNNISFAVHQGEVLGIYGLMGAGRSEVAEAIFGLAPAHSGAIAVFGQRVAIRSPRKAMAQGIALVPEDRRRRGLVLMHGVGNNLSLAALKSLSIMGFVKRNEERREVERIMTSLGIRAASASVAVSTLSGGNQQKVVIGKWLLRPPRILILDEPTRGIDVGAKAEVHAVIDRLAADGMAIVLISSELPEILGLSDRILVMREGVIAGEFTAAQATAENLGAAAAGVVMSPKCAGGSA